jgi:hypothetical protein
MSNEFGRIITGFLVMVVGLALLPTIISSTTSALTTNVTSNKNFLDTIAVTYIVPLIYVIGILAAGLNIMGIFSFGRKE